MIWWSLSKRSREKNSFRKNVMETIYLFVLPVWVRKPVKMFEKLENSLLSFNFRDFYRTDDGWPQSVRLNADVRYVGVITSRAGGGVWVETWLTLGWEEILRKKELCTTIILTTVQEMFRFSFRVHYWK